MGENQVFNTSIYEIMHMEKVVASISKVGRVEIYDEKFMPYDLYLEKEEENDIDTMVNNLDNFYHWCASRVLSLDRKYAKEILIILKSSVDILIIV